MTDNHETKKAAIVGTGPAGLMTAFVVASAGYSVTLFEKRKNPGRKLLIAGSSGLNITHDLPFDEFCKVYKSHSRDFSSRIGDILSGFPPGQWLRFINGLGIKTFLGTSHRYFVEGKKASPLLRAWLKRLESLGVTANYGRECTDFEIPKPGHGVTLQFSQGDPLHFDAVCLALGGGSYEKLPLGWPAAFKKKGLTFHEFTASNVGFEVDWPAPLLAEAEGLPLKNVTLTSPAGKKTGDLMITRYGLEGTPIYQKGEIGTAYLDLKPDLSPAALEKLLKISKENLAPIRRAKKLLNLCPGALALLFHCTPKKNLEDLPAFIQRIKKFPIKLRARRPLAEAISSAGGLDFDELDEHLMLNKFPGVFVAGEMLDWDAPTGGFLIQACASQGQVAGAGIVNFLKREDSR